MNSDTVSSFPKPDPEGETVGIAYLLAVKKYLFIHFTELEKKTSIGNSALTVVILDVFTMALPGSYHPLKKSNQITVPELIKPCDIVHCLADGTKMKIPS